MKYLFLVILVYCFVSVFVPGQFLHAGQDQQTEQTETAALPDSVYMQMFLSHLRVHFDDLHDVIMRFHHRDPSIKGVIAFEMLWRDNKMESCVVKSNGTGVDSLATGLIDKMKAWVIGGLDGPWQTVLPLRVRIVGSQEPDFPKLAILTGFAGDKSGKPLRNAVVMIKSLSDPDFKVPPARTNSEGIFIRTLIPPGDYEMFCVPAKGDTVRIGVRTLTAGQHNKENLVIEFNKME